MINCFLWRTFPKANRHQSQLPARDERRRWEKQRELSESRDLESTIHDLVPRLDDFISDRRGGKASSIDQRDTVAKTGRGGAVGRDESAL